MTAKRRDNIVNILIGNKEWITGKELAGIFNVSDRTIRSDIDKINNTYPKPLIISNLKKGYHIVEENITLLGRKKDKDIPQTPNERSLYIVKELLLNKEGLNLTLLQDQIYISGFSIQNDIKRIRHMISTYPNLKLIKRKNYIVLEGHESSKRKLYKELLIAETHGNFLNLNRIAELYTGFDLLSIKDVLLETLEEYDFKIKNRNLPSLVMHIGISIERIKNYNYITTERNTKEIIESKEYKIAKSFFSKISKTMNINVVESEVVLLAILLLGNKSIDYTEDIVKKYQHDIDANGLINEILEEVNATFGIDFSEDKMIHDSLSTHLQGLFERAKKNSEINNVFLQDIKKKYPLIFEMGIQVVKFIEDRMSIYISENEAGFIALHLGAAYDRMNDNSKFKAIIIMPLDQTFSTICSFKVQNMFNEKMYIEATLPYFEESDVKKINPDIIITTVPLKHNLDIETVHISMFVNDEDESVLLQALNKLNKRKFYLKFSSDISRLIRKEYFYEDIDLSTPLEVINYMCEDMRKNGIVSETFNKSVLEREEKSPTSFAFSFAIPHALGSECNVSTISVAKLKNPILWGEFEVKLVMLLAIREDDYETLKMFFNWMADAISDANKFALLLRSKGYEEFIESIIE